MLAIKAFHVLAIFIEKITFELMSHFFYKNNSEMSWVQQQIAPLLSLNINRLISLCTVGILIHSFIIILSSSYIVIYVVGK